MIEYKDCRNCSYCRVNKVFGIESYYCRLKHTDIFAPRIKALLCRFFKGIGD